MPLATRRLGAGCRSEISGYDIKYWCPLCAAEDNVHGKKYEALQKLKKVQEQHKRRARPRKGGQGEGPTQVALKGQAPKGPGLHIPRPSSLYPYVLPSRPLSFREALFHRHLSRTYYAHICVRLYSCLKGFSFYLRLIEQQ